MDVVFVGAPQIRIICACGRDCVRLHVRMPVLKRKFFTISQAARSPHPAILTGRGYDVVGCPQFCLHPTMGSVIRVVF